MAMQTSLGLYISAPKLNQLKILQILSQEHRITQAELGTQCDLSATMINSYLKSLLFQGLLDVEKTNSRTVRYRVTAAGALAIVALHQARLTEWESLFAEGCRHVSGLITLQEPGILDRTVLFGTEGMAEMAFHALESAHAGIIAVCSEDPAAIGGEWCGRKIVLFSQVRFMAAGVVVIACPRISEFADREMEELSRQGCRIIRLMRSREHSMRHDLRISRPAAHRGRMGRSQLKGSA
jgi:predicted transcriptional regulator